MYGVQVSPDSEVSRASSRKRTYDSDDEWSAYMLENTPPARAPSPKRVRTESEVKANEESMENVHDLIATGMFDSDYDSDEDMHIGDRGINSGIETDSDPGKVLDWLEAQAALSPSSPVRYTAEQKGKGRG